MKNLLLSLAVIGLAFGCRSTDNTTVTDAEGLNAPTECGSASDCATECDAAAKAECSAAASECSSAAKSECSESAAASECSEAKVCPMTGAAIE